jgi:hypothetical protein
LDTEWEVDEHSGFVPAGIAGAAMGVAPTRKASTTSLSSIEEDDGI